MAERFELTELLYESEEIYLEDKVKEYHLLEP